jgi:Spy/CpxP family protein refolding chaperone
VLALRQQSEARRLELEQRIAQVLTPEQRKFVREHGPEMRAFQAGRMMERRRMLQQRRPRGEF